jgi:phosphoglycolate phosphatase
MPGLNSISNVLFDLDGTLVDSSKTIEMSLVHALEQIGVDPLARGPVRSFIGVPLFDIFRGGFGMSENDTHMAITLYRDYYDALNQAGSKVYDQVPEVLSALRDQGYQLFIATVKPTEIAGKVLSDLELRPFFTGVAGASMGPERRDKTGIIAHALDQFGLEAEVSLMVGDRDQDINGARANGLRSVAVSYGFGSLDELSGAKPDHIVHRSVEIVNLLRGDADVSRG